MGSVEGIEEERVLDVEETIYVAVGKQVERSKTTVFWAVQNFARKKLCLLHVHQPGHGAALTKGKLVGSKLKQDVHQAFQQLERQKMHALLTEYLLIVLEAGAQADKIWIEMDNVEEGIVELIIQYKIKWLVMGAASDKYYSRKLMNLTSKKAIFVCQESPLSCHIWFTCKGCLIYTRVGKEGVSQMNTVPSFLADLDMGTEQSEQLQLEYSTRSLRPLDAEEDADELEGKLSRFASQCSLNSSFCTISVVGTPKSILLNEMESKAELVCLDRKISPPDISYSNLSSSAHVISLCWIAGFQKERCEGQATKNINHGLEKAFVDAKNSKRKVFEEAVKRSKEEDNAMEANAKALESLCIKEMSQRKEMEGLLEREKQEVERIKNQCDELMKECQVVQDQKAQLETQIAESQCSIQELEEKIILAVELLISFKKKRDEMRIEHGNAIKEVKELRKLVNGEGASFCGTQILEFSFMEINEATNEFDPSWKIGDGKYGSVYKGLLRHLHVAIRMLPSYGSQSLLKFQNQVELLSRVRHPNLVILIGACPESRSLVYEYLRNGSLEDHLSCRDKGPPLPWETRTRIAAEICSALKFLHSNKPCITHGNFKPSKVLLDSNFVSKISDFGIYRLIPQGENTANSITSGDGASNPKVSSMDVDPDNLETEKVTPESDVYSFGIILLRLLTGRPVLRILRDVKCALENDNLSAVLDSSAGDWPLPQARELAHLALRCCEKNRLNQPDLSEILSVLEPMKASCMTSPSCSGSKELSRIPSSFICPIFQEVMKDPHIAADGFTYEAEAIRGWLKSGHNTSPMTNLKLENCNLLPNYALHQAIQEWQQQW